MSKPKSTTNTPSLDFTNTAILKELYKVHHEYRLFHTQSDFFIFLFRYMRNDIPLEYYSKSNPINNKTLSKNYTYIYSIDPANVSNYFSGKKKFSHQILAPRISRDDDDSLEKKKQNAKIPQARYGINYLEMYGKKNIENILNKYTYYLKETAADDSIFPALLEDLKKISIDPETPYDDALTNCAYLTYKTVYWRLSYDSQLPRETKKNKNINYPELIEEQHIKYLESVCMHPINTNSRFEKLKFLANNDNAWAALELGDLYYTGGILTYESNEYTRVSTDYNLAFYYYQIGADQHFGPACWALADMMYKHTNPYYTNPDYMGEVLRLLDISMEQNYAAGFNTRGVLYEQEALSYMDIDKKARKFLGYKDEDAACKALVNAITYYDRAGSMNYEFAHNRLAALFQNPYYQDFLTRHRSLFSIEHASVEERLVDSIKLQNTWAMNKYANDILWKDPERQDQAVYYFSIAASKGFHWSQYNLASKVYCEDGYQPNEELYVSNLYQASQRRLARATCDLARYYYKRWENTQDASALAQAETLLHDALEQNHNGVDSYKESLETEISQLLLECEKAVQV